MGNLFGGPTTTTSNTSQTAAQSTNTSSNTGSFNQTTTPNLPSWYSNFLSSIPGQMTSLSQSLSQNANTPLYGPQQQAAFQNNLNQTQNQASQTLNSQLASQGALNSGRAAQDQTQLALGGQQQLSNYLSQVPLMNAQNSLQNNQALISALNGQSGFSSPISAYGSTQTGNNASAAGSLASSLSNTNSVQTQQTTPNVLGSLLSGLISGGATAGLTALQNK